MHTTRSSSLPQHQRCSCTRAALRPPPRRRRRMPSSARRSTRSSLPVSPARSCSSATATTPFGTRAGTETWRPRTRMRVTDRFRIGSETKMFVSTVVLQLVGEGKLSLDDTVERRLPGLIPNGSDITVRQLLNHTSGLYDYAEDKAFLAQLDNRRKVWAPRQLIALGTAHKPAFPPGAKWGYSNTGYIALGLMVEDATGNTLGAELRERIFEPLRLRGTSFDTRPQIAGRYAHGYSRLRKPRLYDASFVDPSLFWAAGGDRLDRGRPRPLPRRPAPRPPPPPQPARGDEDDRASDPRAGVRARHKPVALPVRHVLGPRGRHLRIRDVRRLDRQRQAQARRHHRPERGPERALAAPGRRFRSTDGERPLRLINRPDE